MRADNQSHDREGVMEAVQSLAHARGSDLPHRTVRGLDRINDTHFFLRYVPDWAVLFHTLTLKRFTKMVHSTGVIPVRNRCAVTGLLFCLLAGFSLPTGANAGVGEDLGKVFGHIKNAETGEPLVGVQVHLGGPNSSAPRVDETNPNGVYEFFEVEPGEYVIEVDDIAGFDLGEGPDRPSRKVVGVGPGEHVQCNFQFEPLGSGLGEIVGFVKNALNGEPLPVTCPHREGQ